MIYGNGTTTASVGANVRTDFYDRAGVKASTDELVYGKYVDSKSIPKKTGKTFKISRFRLILDDDNNNDQGLDGNGDIIGDTVWIFLNTIYATLILADAAKAAYDATAEGIAAIANNVSPKVIDVTNGGGNAYGSSRDVGNVASGMPALAEGAEKVNRVGVTKETFETTLARYGNYLDYTDEVEMFSEDTVQTEFREKLGHMAGEVHDDATQLGMLGSAGVSVFGGVATTVATVAATEVMDFTLARTIAKRLKKNKAMKNTSMLSGSVKVGTTPINAAYYAIIGPDIKFSVETDSNFKSVHEYGYVASVPVDEVGSMHETRFIETNRAMVHEGAGAAGIDVYPVLYPTKGAYANVGLQGSGKITFKAKAPGKATSEDPYGVKGLFSYNFFYAGIALQPEKLLVAYVAAA